jgi:hypothetical protein
MKKTIKSIWRGESPLWKAFWYFLIGGYFLALIIIGFLKGIFIDIFQFPSIEIFAIFCFVVMFVFLIIAFLAIRRCSKNTKWYGWAWISQGIVFLFIIRNFFSLYIMFTEHIPEINKTKELLTN